MSRHREKGRFIRPCTSHINNSTGQVTLYEYPALSWGYFTVPRRDAIHRTSTFTLLLTCGFVQSSPHIHHTQPAHRKPQLDSTDKDNGGDEISRLSLTRVPSGRSVDHLQRGVRSRDTADRDPLQNYDAIQHGGLLDVLRSRESAGQLHRPDVADPQCLLYTRHDRGGDSRHGGIDSQGGSIFEIRIRDDRVVLDDALVCEGELLGAVFQAF